MSAKIPPARTAKIAEATLVPETEIAEERAKVLVVDDDERNLLAIANVLEDVAEIVVANSGEDALRHLLKTEFAVILLDVFMPGIDGYETAQIIRSREQTKRVPIVFLSAVNKESEHLLRGYSMGAVDYVFKPVEPVVIRSKVAVFVDLFVMRREIQRKARQEQALLDANLRANAERLHIEQELRLVEQRQAAIIESLPIILYLEEIDADPRIPKFVSGNFHAVTGYAFEDIQRDPTLWVDRLHPEDRERAVDSLNARRSGQALSVEYRWQCADGRYRHFLDQAVLLRDSFGNPVEFAGTLLDVTDRKELESQLTQARKMDAIGQLTGGIAHDFNNLLAAVLGGLGMIERRLPLSEEQARIVGMTKHAAQQGAELVKHLLAFARRQKLEPASIRIPRLAQSVTSLLAHTLGGMVELRWTLADNVSPVYADAAQLELAVMNLIINARDAMPEGGFVTVAAEEREIVEQVGRTGLKPGHYVVVGVSDTGCGIAPEMIEQVLEPFFTTKPVGKGTGLGLSMVYGFAQQSGGEVRVDSELGRGTCVEIWLPRAPDAGTDMVLEIANVSAETVVASMRILLVDDHDGVRATTAALLEDLGHKVQHVTEGAHALELFRKDPGAFDLLITDYAMPRMSGAELVRQIRSERADFPALIITGYAQDDLNAFERGDIRILDKPFTPEQLKAALRGAAETFVS